MKKWETHILDTTAQAQARDRWNSIAKPLRSLGIFEDMVVQIAGIQETPDVRLDRRCALIFCADHGVVSEGVSQTGSDVTVLVARSIADGTANINLMAQTAGVDVFSVDMGMCADIKGPSAITRKQTCGTGNIAIGPAMSREQAQNAIQSGIDLIGEMKDAGYQIVVTGEMGIGNTTSSSALACALLNMPVEKMTGRGAGLTDAGLKRKMHAIQRALEVNHPDADDPLDVLSKVGGYEIAGMTGAFLGGMVHRLPVVIDGVISAVSALLAVRMCPAVRDFMLASHMSREPAGRAIMDALGKQPVVDAGMALGEGTGAVMLLPLLDMALSVYKGTHTFDGLGMTAYEPLGGI